jgi:hypothetical protein
MSELKPGPQQPGNDIDIYFSPLVEDLMELWYNDEEHKHEYFVLKAFCLRCRRSTWSTSY